MSVRDKVLKAAEYLFADKGYENTSIQSIIERAEVSKGGLYHHFDSKEEILDALLIDFAKLLREKFESAIKEHNNSISAVFQSFASAKQMLTENKQNLYLRLLFNPSEIIIREKLLHYIREEVKEPFSKAISQFTPYNNPEVLSYLIISLTEIPTRLPQVKVSNPEFMQGYQDQIQLILNGLFEK